jgi:SecD/SecF fusion protein
MSDRRRNLFVLLVALGLLIGSLAVIISKPTKLGLDLKGGVELVYQAKPTKQQPVVTNDAIQRSLDIMRDRVDRLGVAEPELQRNGKDQISVGLPDVKNAKRAQDQVGSTAQLLFYDWEASVIGPDGKPAPDNERVTGGPQAGQVATLSLYDAVKRASERPFENHPLGRKGSLYYLFDKDHRLLAGPEQVREDLFTDLRGQKQPAGSEVLEVKEGTTVVQAERAQKLAADSPFQRYYVLRDDPKLNGTDIKNPEQGRNQAGQPNVTFEFNGEKSRKKWEGITRTIAQRGQQHALLNPARRGDPNESQLNSSHFAAVLDGRVITVPYIDYRDNPDGIDGRTGSEISGGFGKVQEAQDLATLLKSGALPLELKLISQQQVSATLGKQALNQGLTAALAGMAIVILFLLVFYRVLGVIASLALIVYAVYFFALIELIPITLTLPGIAGLILTIGVAADANIVIFERIKEEVRAGRSIPAGIAAGYKKGIATIVDANVVTILTAFILFVLATAGVKGFAFTLGVGTLVSLFTAVLVTQAVLGTMSRSPLLRSRSALGAGEQKRRWTFDFMGASKWFFSASGIILLVCALAVGAKGLNLGIDFESGTRITTNLERSANENQVRSVLDKSGYGDAKIQRVTDRELGDNVFQISTATLQPDEVQRVRSDLNQAYGVTQGSFNSTSIGPTFGKTVANSAIIAIIASLLVISIYIALRFEWKFAIPVVIALMHDILITGGVYALVGREVTTSTVAALLTILGFSLYDTIIVFDRIRENTPRMPRAAFSQIVNRSMSEVLTRSLATSFCTLLPVLCLFFFGGETLKDFAFALIVGIASGTYSSIFIASPVLTHWKEREPQWAARRRRVIAAHDGVLPAYADTAQDVAVQEKRRETAPLWKAEDPNRQVSKSEFEDMVRDLHGDGEAQPVAPGLAAREPRPEREREDKPKREKQKKPRNRRHGRR